MLSFKPWRLEAILQFWGLLFLSWFGGMVVCGLLRKAGIAGFEDPDDPGSIFIGTLSLQGVAWILIGIFLWQHQVSWIDAFGLRDPGLRRALKLAVPVGFAALLIAWLLQSLCVWIMIRLGHPPGDELAVALLQSAKTWWLRAYLGIFAIVLAPVAEEFIFRGMLYPKIKQLGAPKTAFFGINAIFALIHVDMATLVPLFVLGLILTWLYERTDNLLAPISVHAFFNAANYVLLLAFQEHAR